MDCYSSTGSNISIRFGDFPYMKVSRILLAAILSLTLAGVATSQSVSTSDQRKVTKRMAPAYPELAKRMGVSGAVKLEVSVTASGKVKDVRVVGGHPVLANSAMQMVHGWQFEPGAESTEQITVNFTL
jgi:TonB family protein